METPEVLAANRTFEQARAHAEMVKQTTISAAMKAADARNTSFAFGQRRRPITWHWRLRRRTLA